MSLLTAMFNCLFRAHKTYSNDFGITNRREKEQKKKITYSHVHILPFNETMWSVICALLFFLLFFSFLYKFTLPFSHPQQSILIAIDMCLLRLNCILYTSSIIRFVMSQRSRVSRFHNVQNHLRVTYEYKFKLHINFLYNSTYYTRSLVPHSLTIRIFSFPSRPFHSVFNIQHSTLYNGIFEKLHKWYLAGLKVWLRPFHSLKHHVTYLNDDEWEFFSLSFPFYFYFWTNCSSFRF